MRKALPLAMLLLLGLSIGPLPAAEEVAQPSAPFVAGEVLVKFKAGIGAAAAQDLRASALATPLADFPALGIQRLNTSLPVTEAVQRLRASGKVVYAEPNYIVRHTIDASIIPSDPFFSDLWGLHNTGQTGGTPDADIDAPEAWDIETGNSGLVVMVIDSGVDYTHEDLAANMFRNPGECDGDGLDDDGNGYPDDCHGIDVVNGDSDPQDDNGHGTHTAGTIGGVGGNGIGVVGVNHSVRIIGCKFLNALGSGSTAGAIECLEYARALRARGVNLVATNNSWGGGGFSQALQDAIEASGILFLAAAGNSGRDVDVTGPFFPCSYLSANLVCVASTNHTDGRSGFSNFGVTSVDLAAPGSSILSTVPGGYASFSGTSMATPHVAGVAALVNAAFPGISVDTTRCRVLQGVDPIPSMAGITVTGGRLNARGALTTTACDASAAALAGTVAVGGSPVVNAKVTLTSPTAATVTTQTSPIGGYAFDPVSPGIYKVRIRPVQVTTTGAVSGTLLLSGSPVVGVNVKLRNQTTGATASTVTSASGFSFPGVAPGKYRITIQKVTVP